MSPIYDPRNAHLKILVVINNIECMYNRQKCVDYRYTRKSRLTDRPRLKFDLRTSSFTISINTNYRSFERETLWLFGKK